MAGYKVLNGHVALDFGGWKGAFAGKLLAELGAEVILVENIRDIEARRRPPFLSGARDPDCASASFVAYNAGKKSLALDFEAGGVRDVVRSLLGQASFIVESLPGADVRRLGLSFEEVRAVNPEAIIVSVTAFGRACDDPLMERADSLAVAAASGFLYTTGTPDRAPVMVAGDQPFLHASSYAVTAALLAHRIRRRTGRGTHVDVSAQEAMALTLGPVMPAWQVDQRVSKRVGNSLPGRDHPRSAHAVADGWVTFSAVLGRPERVIAWMEERGEPGTSELRDRIGSGLNVQTDSDEKLRDIEERFEAFLAKVTRAEAWEAALDRRFMMFPVNSMEDIIASPIHEERGFLSTASLESEPPVHYPTRLIPHIASGRQRVERRGESTLNILRRFGFDEPRITSLWRDGVI